MWGISTTIFIVLLNTFFFARTLVAVWTFEWLAILVFGGLALGVFFLYRGLFVGLAEISFVPRREVDVVIGDDSAAILLRGKRWHLFLDGIQRIQKYRSDVWTIEHYNGWILHVPVAALPEEQLAHMRAAMERGRTPEGVRAVVERGRRIEALMQARRAAPRR
jgi:hypothetical protein